MGALGLGEGGATSRSGEEKVEKGTGKGEVVGSGAGMGDRGRGWRDYSAEG